MTADPEVFHVVDGRWIPRRDIATLNSMGVQLHDGRVFHEPVTA